MSKAEYSSFSYNENMQMLKRFYTDLVYIIMGRVRTFFYFAEVMCLLLDDENFVLPSQVVK